MFAAVMREVGETNLDVCDGVEVSDF